MTAIADLQSRYRAERLRQPFRALPEFGEGGLMLGRGRRLARVDRASGEACFGADADRLTVLLSAVHGRPVSPLVLSQARRAAGHWRRGAKALAPRDRARPAAADDGPQLCPAPTKDTSHGASERAMDHEDDVHARVNPLAPIPRGFGVKVLDPATGKSVFFDDCFRYAGDLVDGDMRPGDLAEAKGLRKAYLYSQWWSRTMAKDVVQARKESRAAKARGVGLKWYYAEKEAADMMRERLEQEKIRGIVIGVMPPRRRR